MNYLKKELYNLIKSDEAIFDFIQESSLDGLWYWDLEKPNEEWMNPKFWTTLGYDPKKMPHKASAWQHIIFPEDLELASANFQKHSEDANYPYDQVVRYRHKNGSTVWIRCRGLAIRDENGKPLRVLGAHINITEEKRKQQLLIETNRVAKVGAWEVDAINEKVYWTTVTKEIHEVAPDYQPDMETGINFYKEGRSRELITRCITAALEEGTPFDEELQIVTAKGKVLWVRAVAKVDFVDGKCHRVYGVFQDISEKKIAEEKLKKERTFLQTLIDNLPVNVYVKDLESRKTLVNLREIEYLNVQDASAILGKDESEFYPPKYVQESKDEDLFVFKTRQSILNKETINVKKDGTETCFLSSKIPLTNENDEITSLLGISYDVTKYKQTEEKLRQLSILEAKSKEMEQFAYIASHDLREPLTTIKGYLNLLSEEFFKDMSEDAQNILKYTLGAAERMDQLIHGLLDYSRLSEIKELTMVDCNKVLQDVLVDLSAQISEANTIFDTMLLPTIPAHPLELKLLFQNLISNALKFKKENEIPRISIFYKKVVGGWTFQISDNGIGIEPQEKKKIFHIFQRIHKQAYDGTGIGLANCKKIAELHNGDIWVESALGKGSTFYFTILTEDF